jgi:hypothetical protein
MPRGQARATGKVRGRGTRHSDTSWTRLARPRYVATGSKIMVAGVPASPGEFSRTFQTWFSRKPRNPPASSPRRIAGAAQCSSGGVKEMTDPVAGCCVLDGLALCIDIGPTRAVS